jgi:hypothetical protein
MVPERIIKGKKKRRKYYNSMSQPKSTNQIQYPQRKIWKRKMVSLLFALQMDILEIKLQYPDNAMDVDEDNGEINNQTIL